MREMGYTNDIHEGLTFPEGQDSDRDKLAEIVGDILLAKRELDAYINCCHPFNNTIEACLPQHVM